MKKVLLTITLITITTFSFGQINDLDQLPVPSLVDYEAFAQLVLEVQPHRKERLVSIDKFNAMSQEENVIILDTRSKEMYDSKHVKGAIHLNFSDFTQETLSSIIPSTKTKILIYCNNNFGDDPIFFATKSYVPPIPKEEEREITLALNIPTYINLYGYGYKNVYELSELISVFDDRIEFEGTSVEEDTPIGKGKPLKSFDIQPREIKSTK